MVTAVHRDGAGAAVSVRDRDGRDTPLHAE